MTRGSKPPTIKEIAEKLGICHTTVSRALHNRGRMGSGLRQKILNEADRMGYRRNPAAVSLRYQTSHLVGMLVNSLHSFTIDEMISEIQRISHERSFGILLGDSNLDAAREIELLKFMAAKQVEGIILQCVNPPSAKLKAELKHMVASGQRIINLLDKLDVPGVCSVIVDNEEAGYLAGRHLLELGHKRILYIADGSSRPRWPRSFSEERYAGLLRAYREAGVARPRGLRLQETHPYPGYHTVTESLRQKLRFSAVLGFSERVVIGAAHALREHGRPAPDHCSLVSFVDSQYARDFDLPPLTAIRFPFDQVGAAAIGRILPTGTIEKRPPDVMTIKIQPQLVVRESTRSHI